MTSKRDLWYTGLVLVTLERCRNLIIGFLVVNYPYRQNFRSLGHPHGLEEAPVVHQPVPDHLGDFFWPRTFTLWPLSIPESFG